MTDVAELLPGNLVYLKRYGPGLTGHTPSESHLTFSNNSCPLSDLGKLDYYY